MKTITLKQRCNINPPLDCYGGNTREVTCYNCEVIGSYVEEEDAYVEDVDEL